MFPPAIPSFFKSRTVLGIIWTALTLLVLWADYLSGPIIQFPVFILLPLSLAAWYNGKSIAFIISLFGVAASGILFPYLWHQEQSPESMVINTAIRLTVFVLILFLVDKLSRLTRNLKTEVKVLEGLLPVCSFCKKIRDRDETWYPMEKYIADHSRADFTHGVCPECARKHYGFILKDEP
ncbi:MAG: hypothetical protein JW838_13665 [Spirochaetes bacterium]|nr:hypothetical protein [Spirochaetota bacterium]